MTKFEEIWKEATEKTDMKYNEKGTLSWVVFLKEELKSRIEPIIQQQALPVVKDFVADWYEGHKDNLDFEIYNFCCDLFKTKSEFATWFGNAENNSISTLIKMKDGYTVEKPQLFYLKEKNFGYYIANEEMPGIDSPTCMYIENAEKFTQQEIDSMETGSYEKIEVAQ